MPATPLVDAAWLRARRADPDVVVVDVRWYLDGRRGRDAYAAGHVPGAVFADLDVDLARPRGTGPGRHPLPPAAALAEVLAGWGVGPVTTVVAYDDAGGAIASRLWWLLDAHGHPGAAVLDGGWAAWLRAGGEAATEPPPARPRAAPLPLKLAANRIVDADGVERARQAPGALVLDARATSRYAGDVEPIDARPGHVPGARSAPFADNLDAEGRFRSPAALRARYEALGAFTAEPLIAYCGSGVTACHALLALTLAGRADGRLYEGSWSDWAADPARPAARGPDPG